MGGLRPAKTDLLLLKKTKGNYLEDKNQVFSTYSDKINLFMCGFDQLNISYLTLDS